MNPLLKELGLTPTAAIAFRAKNQEARQAYVAKIQANAAAQEIELSKDAYASAIESRRNASKLDADGNVVEIKFNWDPDNKIVTVEQSGTIVETPTDQFKG